MPRIIRTLFTVLAGIMAFIVWIQVWIPLTSGVLWPILENEQAVPYASWVKALLMLLPLIMAGMILILPFFEMENPN